MFIMTKDGFSFLVMGYTVSSAQNYAKYFYKTLQNLTFEIESGSQLLRKVKVMPKNPHVKDNVNLS